jgi:hypothetical protein
MGLRRTREFALRDQPKPAGPFPTPKPKFNLSHCLPALRPAEGTPRAAFLADRLVVGLNRTVQSGLTLL